VCLTQTGSRFWGPSEHESISPQGRQRVGRGRRSCAAHKDATAAGSGQDPQSVAFLCVATPLTEGSHLCAALTVVVAPRLGPRPIQEAAWEQFSHVPHSCRSVWAGTRFSGPSGHEPPIDRRGPLMRSAQRCHSAAGPRLDPDSVGLSRHVHLRNRGNLSVCAWRCRSTSGSGQDPDGGLNGRRSQEPLSGRPPEQQ